MPSWERCSCSRRCTSSSSQEHKVSTQEKASAQEHKAHAPHINPSEFSTSIDNEYLPLKPGTTFVYEGGAERDEITVTHDTKKVMGVECVVVDDRAWEDSSSSNGPTTGSPRTSKAACGTRGGHQGVRELQVVRVKGSWRPGVDGAKPGIIMQADPKVGQSYHQEYYKGEAEDMARVQSLNESVTVPYGSFDHVLVTREWTPLEPSYDEHKYYALGWARCTAGAQNWST